MHNTWRTFVLGSAFAASVLTASTIYADSPRGKHGPIKGHNGMMGKGMGRMGEMMEGCARMMGERSSKPNDQWRKKMPSTPDKKS